jgi:hypothetical protein
MPFGVFGTRQKTWHRNIALMNVLYKKYLTQKLSCQGKNIFFETRFKRMPVTFSGKRAFSKNKKVRGISGIMETPRTYSNPGSKRCDAVQIIIKPDQTGPGS